MTVFSFDIASAYPHAYTKLPCLVKGHGEWHEVEFTKVVDDNLQNTLIVAEFICQDEELRIGGLPMRDKQGGITFPTKAHGVWWAPEVLETIRLYDSINLNYTFHVYKCITWTQTCDDQPGSFIRPLFDYRKRLGKGSKGFPIKLMLNSLYGKAAQKVGRPKWANGVWAGLITSITRARLLEATRLLGPDNIISYQTDGLISKVDGLVTSEELGGWERQVYNEFFLFQSGVYTFKMNGETKSKTRGMTPTEFTENREGLVKMWEDKKWFGIYKLKPDRKAFITINLGLQWGKPELIGTWVNQPRAISFQSNMEKREIFSYKDNKPTPDGSTYAPGTAHAKTMKRKYGPHPLMPEWKDAGFTYPYTRQLAAALREKSIQTKLETMTYSTPSDPYSVIVQED